MSTNCVVIGCTNSAYTLKKWEGKCCGIHAGLKHEKCGCKPPFKLVPFPGAKRNPENRKLWIRLINRKTNNNKPWVPGVKGRVCSNHFMEGFLHPIKNLGYDSVRKVKCMFPELCKDEPRKMRRESRQYEAATLAERSPAVPNSPTVTTEKIQDTEEKFSDEEMDIDMDISSPANDNESLKYKLTVAENHCELMDKDNILLQQEVNARASQAYKLLRQNKVYKHNNKYLRKKVASCVCLKPVYKKLLTSDKKVTFYTGIKNLPLFHKIHNECAPYMRRKYKGNSRSYTITKNFKKIPSKLGPKMKLTTQDEFLLTLMKLRLGLMEQDLADRFKVSLTTTSSIFASWIKVMAAVLGHMVHFPNQGALNFTRPKRFDKCKDVHSIIDGTEVFIETTKNPELQKLTWSEYKHHNTVKFLVACTTNSTINFVSEAYPGSISDKAIVRHSKYLEKVPMYSTIMADKGFNIANECLARNIKLYVPPGKRGTYQMLPSELNRTKRIANLRILIEQVIRRMKTFKILAQEFPIKLLPKLDDIALVCCALCNLYNPIFKD